MHPIGIIFQKKQINQCYYRKQRELRFERLHQAGGNLFSQQHSITLLLDLPRFCENTLHNYPLHLSVPKFKQVLFEYCLASRKSLMFHKALLESAMTARPKHPRKNSCDRPPALVVIKYLIRNLPTYTLVSMIMVP